MLGCIRSSDSKIRANGFALSLCSPVLHKMICGGFSEGTAKRLEFHDVDASAFSAVFHLNLGSGAESHVGLDGAMALYSVADRFQMCEAADAIEDAVIAHLTVDTCADVLAWSGALACGGAARVAAAARGVALAHFEALSRTAGFARIEEELLCSLVDDDALVASREREVLDAVLRWAAAAAAAATAAAPPAGDETTAASPTGDESGGGGDEEDGDDDHGGGGGGGGRDPLRGVMALGKVPAPRDPNSLTNIRIYHV